MQDSSPWGQGGSGPQPPAEPAAPPPNWYPDPQDAARFRYWDGNRWTERTRPAATTPMAAAYRPLGGLDLAGCATQHQAMRRLQDPVVRRC